MAVKIIMVQSQAGSRFTRSPGDELTVGEDVSKEEAARMVRRGLARPSDGSTVDMKVLQASDERVLERMTDDERARQAQYRDKPAKGETESNLQAEKPRRGRKPKAAETEGAGEPASE